MDFNTKININNYQKLPVNECNPHQISLSNEKQINEFEQSKMKNILILFIIMILIIIIFLFAIVINNNKKINSKYSNKNTHNNNIQYTIYKNDQDDVIYKDSNKEILIKRELDFLEICKEKSEIEIADLYFKVCENGVLFNKTFYQNVENPKISIILTLYNREKYILRILRSIQNQPMKDIEIIFVDDGSTDNSVKVIEKFQKYDKRMILIKQEVNKGTLISRNDGAKKAKGDYLLFSDSDDLLLYNILNKTYEAARKGDYGIVQFAVYRRSKKGKLWNYGEIRKNKPIYQPELSSLMYYYRGYLKQTDWHIWGKLIKKEAFYKALYSINSYYLNTHMSINEDGLVDFMLLKKAKSYIYINDYGYVYVINSQSVIKSLKSMINKAIRDYFLYLKFLFENTGNNFYEKSMAGEQLKFVYFKFLNNFKEVTENFDFLYDILNLYINSIFIKKINKQRAKNIKGILEETEKTLFRRKRIKTNNI